MFDDLAGKVALIAGGGGGLGAAQASLLSELGTSVMIADISEERCIAAARACTGKAEVAVLDVREERSWRDVIDKTQQLLGPVSVLVNTFGVAPQGELVALELKDYLAPLMINQVGVYLGMRAVANAMRAAGNEGAIVNISSGAGISPMPRLFAYSATKAAVIAMTKAGAIELGPDRIRVNCVCPGAFATELQLQTAETWRASGNEELANTMAHLPIPRLGRPDELANLVAFLSSDASSYCTGGVFLAEGGALAGRTR